MGPGRLEAAVMAERVAGERLLLAVGSQITRVEFRRLLLFVVM